MKWLRDRIGWDVEVHEGRRVGVIFKGSNIATYNLQIFAPDERYGPEDEIPIREPIHRESEIDKRLLADLPAMLELVEEQIEGLLPDGYRVRITEWNK